MFTNQTGGAKNVTLANFSMFGNVTQRDVLDYLPGLPMGVHGQFTNSTFDNIWVEHYFIGINFNSAPTPAYTASSNNVTVSNSRVRNSFADGIDFYGGTSNSTVKNSSSRSNGDDGFALWAQGSTFATISQSNTVTNCKSQLSWWGNGFAIYGGNNMTLTNSNAYDILNYSCLQASTNFVSASLPLSASMSASVSNMNFYRCGGNGFNQQYGAVLIGTDTESLNGISLSNINIYGANYKAFDFRTIGAVPVTSVGATMTNVNLSHINVVNSPVCGIAGANLGGRVQWGDVCYCATATSTPVNCSATNASPTTLTFTTASSCELSSCQNVLPSN